MRFPLPLALLASGVLCGLTPLNPGQEILNNANAIGEREKVPGENPAYYSRIPKADQLFKIEELIVSPNLEYIRSNTTRLFTYLRGSISPSSSTSPSLLASATLTLTATVDGTTYEITEKISEHGVFSVRKEGGYGEQRKYGGPLVEGENVLVGDMAIGNQGEERRVDVRVEAVARLGGMEGKVLWAIEGRVEVEI